MAIGETISTWLWGGPPDGAASFYSAATALNGVVTQISNILGGQQANNGVLLTAWASPTGEKAVSANSPYGAWLSEAAAQIETAATQIQAAGAAFDFAKGMTPTPAQFAANNVQFAVLMATNILGQNWPAIIANRVEYATYTMQAVTAYSFYSTESTGTVGALQPLAAPPVSATPGALSPSISAGLAGQQPFGQATPGTAALPSVGSAVAPAVSAGLQPLSATSSLLSQPAEALATSGGELAQAPSAMTSGLGGLPSAMSSGLGSPAAASGSAGADPAGWYGAPGAGGTVAAALSGGAAGLSGLGGAVAPMRGPVSWASTDNADAANPTQEADEVAVSRIAEARGASATPATSAGMGAPGAMMPPGQASGSERERERDDTLASAAVLYRPPRNMPVVTGAAGAQFVAGEED
jgi:PPE-repeat protein